MRKTLARTTLILALLVPAACQGGGGSPVAGATGASSHTGSPSPSLTPSPAPSASGCSNQQAVLSTARFLKPGVLVGDVDGDGGEDAVRLAVDLAAAQGCQAFIVVHTGSGSLAAPLSGWDPTAGLPAPHLNSLAQINGGAGSEIIIDVAQGASTQFEDVFTWQDGALVPMTLEGVSFTGSFAYGGSVGHLDGEACPSNHTLVVSSAIPNGVSGRRYAVVRRFFRGAGSVLRLEPSLTQHRLLRAVALVRLPEFAGGPFAGCAAS